MIFPLWPLILSTITFMPPFGQITKLSLSFVTFRVSRFLVSHLTHETVKLGLQNTLNMSKTTRVYFGVLQGMFLISRLWAKILFEYGASHSFMAASSVDVLGLEVETLDESIYVSSPVGTMVRID